MYRRSVGLCIVFTLITCGIYGIYWLYHLTEDVNNLSRSNDTSGGMVILFTFLTCGLYIIYWAYRMGEKINIAKSNRALPDDSSAKYLYLILTIFGFSIISMAIMQYEINSLIDYQ